MKVQVSGGASSLNESAWVDSTGLIFLQDNSAGGVDGGLYVFER